MTPRIVTVMLNAAVDQTLSVPGFAVGRVNRVVESRVHAGGKGVNVASFLADLGAEAVATGFLGRDNARLFEDHFAAKKIRDEFVRIPGATRVCIKISDDSTGQTTDINLPGLAPTADELDVLSKRLEGLVEPGRWVALMGSLPPGLGAAVYGGMVDAVRRRGGRVLVDTSGPALRAAVAAGPEVIKPNLQELSELMGSRVDGIAGAAAAARSLLTERLKLVVVSMGAEGAVFVTASAVVAGRPPEVVVRSSVGAGDAMVSGVLWGMSQGLDLKGCARLATGLGAYAVTRVGSGIESPGAERGYIDGVSIE